MLFLANCSSYIAVAWHGYTTLYYTYHGLKELISYLLHGKILHRKLQFFIFCLFLRQVTDFLAKMLDFNISKWIVFRKK